MPPSKVWFIVRQVASGLLHASHQNLIHRDIKPANLILVPPPEGSPWPRGAKIVKITDFGLALFADSEPDAMKLTTGDKIMGSPAYMSLEQFGLGEVDFRTDMYALGATAWHLLFGAPPFRGGSVGELIRQKSTPLAIDPNSLPIALPEDQLRLLLGLLDPDPNRRPQSYEQLIDAIDRLGVSEPVPSESVPSESVPSESVPSESVPSESVPSEPASSAPVPSDAVGIESVATQPDHAAAYTGRESARFSRVAISEQPTFAAVGVPHSATQVNRAAAIDRSAAFQDSAAQTIELSASMLNSSRPAWHKWLLVTAIAAVAIMVMLVLATSFKPGPRLFTRVTASIPLFDGVTLQGWDVGGSMSGAWNTVEAPDASTAIACTTPQGALTRQIPDVENPRITIFVWPTPGSGTVDLDFAFDPADTKDIRGCLRLEGTSCKLGTKRADFDELDIVTQTDAPHTIHDRYHVIHIERQPSDWFVFLEEQLIGTLPITQIGMGHAIRLVIRSGNRSDTELPIAFFADVQLDDLRSRER